LIESCFKSEEMSEIYKEYIKQFGNNPKAFFYEYFDYNNESVR